jgi:PAS domain S-box-containing protein
MVKTNESKLEQKIKELEQRVDLHFNHVKDSIFIADIKTGILLNCNKSAEELIERKKEDIIGKPQYILHPESKREEYQKFFKEHITNLGTNSYDAEVITSSGEIKYVDVKAQVSKLGDKKVIQGVFRDITEKKKLEQSLLEEKKLLEAIINGIPDLVAIQKPDHSIIKYNQKGYDFLNMTPLEVIGKKCYKLLGQDKECIPCATSKAIKTKKTAEIEKFIPEFNKYLNCRSNPVFDEEGNVDLIVEIIRDITQHRKIEKNYKNIFNKMINGFAIHEIITNEKNEPINYKFLEVNPAFESITGLKKSEIIGKTVLDVLPNTEKIWIEKYGKVALIGKPITFEEYSTEINKFFFVTAYQHQKNQFACIFNDITDKKKAEIKFERYIQNSPTSIFITNNKGNYIFANPSVSKLLGYSLDELLKLSIPDILPKEEVEKGLNNFLELKEKGESYNFETKFKRKDNKIIDIILDGKKLSDNEYIAYVRNITPLKNYQRELIQSKEKAEEINEIKDAFLRNMSHELRTPLNGMLGLTQLLMESNIPKEEREMAKTIYKSGKHLTDIIGDILTITKIKNNKESIEKNNFDLYQLLTNVVDLYDSNIKSSNIKLTFDYDSSIPKNYIGDDKKIKQIVNHLISNAIKFNDKGKVNLFVSGENKTNNSIDCIISLSDTGIGISKENLDKIYDCFYQSDCSLTRKYGGTGIGLAITKDLISLLNGEIKVESELNKGSTFTVKLPLELYQEEKQKETSDKKESYSLKEKDIPNLLIVEDEPVNRMILEMMIKKMGYKSKSVEDGIYVLDYLKNNNECNAILMDCKMPQVDGYTATKKIREWEKDLNKRIPIIAVTAHIGEEERQKCLDSGMNDYLSKPVALNSLKEKIDYWIKT